jgi:hypothetical protein
MNKEAGQPKRRRKEANNKHSQKSFSISEAAKAGSSKPMQTAAAATVREAATQRSIGAPFEDNSSPTMLGGSRVNTGWTLTVFFAKPGGLLHRGKALWLGYPCGMWE